MIKGVAVNGSRVGNLGVDMDEASKCGVSTEKVGEDNSDGAGKVGGSTYGGKSRVGVSIRGPPRIDGGSGSSVVDNC